MDGKSMGEGIRWMMRVLFVLGALSGMAMLGAIAWMMGWLG